MQATQNLCCLSIVLCVLLRFTISVDPFGIFKLIRPLQEESKDTEGVMRISKSKNDKQHNGQKKKE